MEIIWYFISANIVFFYFIFIFDTKKKLDSKS